jgi:hypothetical protein
MQTDLVNRVMLITALLFYPKHGNFSLILPLAFDSLYAETVIYNPYFFDAVFYGIAGTKTHRAF